MSRAAVGLGSNLGSREAFLRAALDLIESTPGLSVRAVSRAYETEPVGPPQPRYFNAACLVESGRPPAELLGALHGIEDALGRVRTPARWGPRTLDLDLLTYGDEVLLDDRLVIPHPGLHERTFALAPLLDLDPNAKHPALKMALTDLLRKAGGAPPRSWPLERTPAYELLEHAGDIGFRTQGRDFADLAAACATTLFFVMVDPAGVRGLRVEPIRATAPNRAEALVAFLAEALYAFDVRGFCARGAVVAEATDGPAGTSIAGALVGEPLEVARHRVLRPVKAVTHHALRIESPAETGRDEVWSASVVLDL